MVPKTTEAIRVHEQGAPRVLRLEEVPLPGVGPNDVAVAVEVAGVSYPDLLRRSGALPASSYPFSPGFEAAGRVIAVGASVLGIAVGDRVAVELHREGGYAKHVVADASAVIVLPPELSSEAAVSLLFGGRTALLMLRHARVEKGTTVFVPSAAGGVGSFLVALAKRFGATVIAGVSSVAKHDLVRGLGADAVVDVVNDWREDVRRLTNGHGADVVFHSSKGWEALGALAPGGRLVLFGADNVATPEPLEATSVRSLVAQSQSIGGFAFLGTPEAVRRAAFDELAQMVVARELEIVVERYPLARAAEAHEAMEARRTRGRVVLTM